MAKGWQKRSLVSLCAALILSAAAVCQAEMEIHQIKVAYLYQISKFVFWPEQTKAAENFKVCQLGPDRYGGSLKNMNGRTVFSRPVIIEFIGSLDQAQSCHLLILSDPEEIKPQALKEWLASHPVLTVVDGEHNWGVGMVAFVLEKQRVRLHINLNLAQHSGLSFAANLLEVASFIHGTGKE